MGQVGNPYHDELGRFTTPWGAIKLSDSSIADYALMEAEAWQENHSEVEPDGYEYGQPYLREASYDQAMEDELNNRAYEVEGEIRELNKEYNKRICERIKTADYEQLKSYVEHPEEYDKDIREQLESEYNLYHADMMLDSMAEEFPSEIADLRYRRIVAKCNGNRKLFAMAVEEKDGYGLNGYASDYATQAIKTRGLEKRFDSWKYKNGRLGIAIDGPLGTRQYLEAYGKDHPEIVRMSKKYKDMLNEVNDFQKKYPHAEDATYDRKTGKIVEPHGYSLTFHQNQSLEDRFGGYTKDEYARMCAVAIAELDSKDVYIGCFGNPEVSFTCEDFEIAMIFAIKHNQHSIWNNDEADPEKALIVNPFYNPTTNPTD